jgi:hypothetical protein
MRTLHYPFATLVATALSPALHPSEREQANVAKLN